MGWSLGILAGELTTAYQAALGDHPTTLDDLPLQYADFATWQRLRLEGPVMAEQIEFWNQHLRGAPEYLALPYDRPRGPRESQQGASIPFRINRERAHLLTSWFHSQGLTPFMGFQALFAIQLMRYSGAENLVIGTTTGQRKPQEIETLIGFFNQYPRPVSRPVRKSHLIRFFSPNPQFMLASIRESRCPL